MWVNKLLPVALYGAAGAGIALVAWYPGHWLAALLALPLLWSACRSRRSAGALWLAYYLVAARDIPTVCARFFLAHGDLAATSAHVTGWLLWMAQACALATPWIALKPVAASQEFGLWWRSAIALIAVTVPPLGIIGWVSPLHIASCLFPGLGICSLVCALLVFVALASYRQWLFIPLRTVGASMAFTVLLLPPAFSDTPHPSPTGWVSIDTAMGQLDQSSYASRYARSQMLQQTAREAFDAGARVVVLPEEMTGLWRDSTQFWWDRSVTQLKNSGQTLVLGVDVPVSETPRRYTDSAMALGADDGRVDSRQPVPAGLWRPMAPVSAVLGKLDQGFLTIDGHRVAFSICYEDFLFWPHWRALLDRPDVLLGLANNWFDDGLAVGQIQRQSIASIARIVGAPLLRAVNVSPSSNLTQTL